MENKTVTIHPPVDVPEGDKCLELGKGKYECDSYQANWCWAFHAPVEDDDHISSSKTKCQQCLDACEKEKAKEPCDHDWIKYGTPSNPPYGLKCIKCGKWEEIKAKKPACLTCGGSEEILGTGIFDKKYDRPCPNCQPKGEE